MGDERGDRGPGRQSPESERYICSLNRYYLMLRGSGHYAGYRDTVVRKTGVGPAFLEKANKRERGERWLRVRARIACKLSSAVRVLSWAPLVGGHQRQPNPRPHKDRLGPSNLESQTQLPQSRVV